MEKRDLLYEGKAKRMFRTNDESVLWVEYLDQVTALNGGMKDQMQGKAELNNQITSAIFEYLATQGIKNHFIEKLSKTEQLIKKRSIIPLEVVVRNISAGSFSKRLGVEEGQVLPTPIVEFYYKKDELNDPFINDAHVTFLELATPVEIAELKKQALQINEHLSELFKKIDLQLVDFKVEFGRTASGEIELADEISPDTCRLWDLVTHEHMDKDVYRRKIGDIIPVYQEVLNRLNQLSIENKGE
ncbi:phosphoribosylaminoimidazolesuccinocarboxamide synthase [Enterococcus sp. DIV1298c]|uniref:Phosphoribosylaminoimidazole-succinocarboxamide synthase n=1 Tax=Candidatus Enterococcus mangumiae TaxID=2230878 RepID=A0ABZ2T298_9ENTE|nr:MULTISPECIES: phosphoribosylaminoimidazolesuccinocarboxamide synthase [unclassified Enterococcus]MBO0460403.1 phosphoribosylaminoimidazolesuccinocarboxamide synthase [Enterococcus sp. DIV1298c]MBO0490759.1 phosphoribosylaminoimidazolesuccinocarboxamide synthase [Enterococcus sp. DIV1094]